MANVSEPFYLIILCWVIVFIQSTHGFVTTKLNSIPTLSTIIVRPSVVEDKKQNDGRVTAGSRSRKNMVVDDDDIITTTTTTTSTEKVEIEEQQQQQKSDNKNNDITKATTKNNSDDGNEKFINDFCIGTNEFWKKLVIKPVRDYVQIQPAGTSESDIMSKLIAPPEIPGISRPVWFTILGSVPTALGWYGYYKFSVEEELYQYELQNKQPVTGCGGYGTLFPFVYAIIIGFPLSLLHLSIGDLLIECAGVWILLGQVNLYRRVNELCAEEPATNNDLKIMVPSEEDGDNDDDNDDSSNSSSILEPPLHAWWALLPPPLDVVVGLRQVHFLSEFWRIKRGDTYQKDIIAEELFPFISSPRFTLKEFIRTPSMWFWFTKDWDDFDQVDFLKD